MDGDKRSAQVERLEVVDTGRRRRWSEDEKLKIVLESLQAPRSGGALPTPAPRIVYSQ
jgi:transposase